MKPHPTIRLLLVVFLSLVLFAPGSVSAGLGRAAPTIPIYFLFHPQFIKNDTGASSTLFLRNSTAYFVQLSFYSEQGEWKLSQDYDVAPHSVLRVGGKEVPALPNGTYGLVVDSTARVQSVVRTLEIGAPEKLVAYAGQSTELTSRRYGPVYKKTSGLNSSIKILNTSPVPSDVTARYLSNAGLVAGTQTFALPPYGVGTFSNTLLPDGFEGWASVTSTGPMVGILLLSDSPANTVREARGPLDVETATADASVTLKRLDQVTSPLYFTACVPRALKHADQGAGPRSTTIFAGNTYAGVANAEVAFYDSGGNAVSPAVAFILPAEGAKNIQLADLAGLPNGAWAACIVSDQQLVVGELTTLDSVASANETTYGAPPTADLGQPYGVVLPRLVNDESAHTIFTVQNTGSIPGETKISLYDLTGSPVYEDSVTLAPSGWKAYDLSQIPELGADFEGSGAVASAVPLIGIADEFARPLFPPAAITDLEASKDDGKVKLDWTEVEFDIFGQSITDATYHVYRAQDAPYFLPAAANAAYEPGLTSSPWTDSDTTVLTNSAHSTYYVVKAVYQGLLSGPSNRVGAFVFGLVPGSSGAVRTR